MVVSLKHKFNSAKADGVDATAVKPSNWNDEHNLTAVAGKVLGTPVGSTTVSELPLEVDSTLQSVKLPAGTTANRPASPGAGMFRYNTTTSRLEYYTNSAWKSVDNMTVSASQPATAIAGDLWVDTANSNALKLYTGSVWVTANAIADASITYSKIQNISATSRILGRKTAAAGVTEELTLSELLDFVGSAAQGDVLYRGASGWVRLPAGTANQVLTTGGAAANPSWSFGSNAPDVIIQDQKTQGTNGGTFSSGANRTRTLNTLVRNAGSLASLASNRFTLPAGTYYITWSAPALQVQENQSLLQNITDATTVQRGSNQFSQQVSATAVTYSSGSAVVTITGSKAFEIQHRCDTTKNDDGFGRACNLGTEIYTTVEIWRTAP